MIDVDLIEDVNYLREKVETIIITLERNNADLYGIVPTKVRRVWKKITPPQLNIMNYQSTNLKHWTSRKTQTVCFTAESNTR